MIRPTLFVLVLAAATLSGGDALARRGGRDDTKVRERVTLTASDFAGRARLEVRRDSPDRQEIRLDAERTSQGEDFRVWIEDATGQMTEIAPMTETRPGRYTWRVRTKKGAALPFGQSDVAGLSGRTVEIRTAAGDVAFTAAFPVVSAAKAPVRTKRALRTNLAVNRTVADAIGAPGLAAHTEVSLRRGGRQRFGVKVENAVPGQRFEVWVEDPATGRLVFLSTLTTGSGTSLKRGGSDDGDDGDADDDTEIEGDEDEGEVEIDTEDGDDLPVGAADVSDLAGLDVEVRTESGDVVAEGEIAAVGDTPRADDDDDDGIEDGEDADDDEDGDDDTDEDTDDAPPPPVLKR